MATFYHQMIIQMIILLSSSHPDVLCCCGRKMSSCRLLLATCSVAKRLQSLLLPFRHGIVTYDNITPDNTRKKIRGGVVVLFSIHLRSIFRILSHWSNKYLSYSSKHNKLSSSSLLYTVSKIT
eukprot:scaffold10175_cov268-Chaetoceros_neogracile.AAC.23